MLSTNDIRKAFLDFYKSKGHTVLPSASLLPDEDEETLLFTVAGMVPLKKVMLGEEKRPYKRATSSQKCLRAGGKQNDLDNVGYTSRHHTFFEMLGNFSFGDYFKEEAIKFSWELLTKVFELPKDRLTVTVHYTDEDAAKLWNKIAGIPDSEIIRLDKDNFWAMGDTGPCGPSTEIFFDYGDGVKGGKPGTPDEDGDRYVEIYNNVFMQNVRTEVGGDLKELSQKNIDTGMGLERIASVLQNKHSNYDTDIFVNIKNFASDLFKINITDKNRNAFNVCADHIRAASFAIADGIVPSNEGRGYVIRKIIRRAMRYINSLGIKDICFYKLADSVCKEMGSYYTELNTHLSFIKSTIEFEEKLFMDSLHKGMSLLCEMINNYVKNSVLDGKLAFKLYDTYGFPLDMTQDILRNKNISIDIDGFNLEMQKQKSMSKFHGKNVNKNIGICKSIDIDMNIINGLKDSFGDTDFVGYDTYTTKCKILKVIENMSEKDKNLIGVITDKTSFYSESGGQIADTGEFILDNKIIANVIDVKSFNKIFVHFVKLVDNFTISEGMEVVAQIDKERRHDIAKNHSCIHLLQSALIEALGDHIKQKGSFVCDRYARFDFVNPRALKDEEIQKIELLVNNYIDKNLPVSKLIMPIDNAKKTGAIAPFGEKYDDIVRVIKIGDISTEFCGGTHVDNTSEIGVCIIEKEESIASGIRRIIILSGKEALEKLKSVNAQDVVQYRKILLDESQKKQDEINRKKQLEKEDEIKKFNLEFSAISKNIQSEQINDITFNYVVLSDVSHKACNKVFQHLKATMSCEKGFAAFITKLQDKVSISLAITDSLKDTVKLNDLIRNISPIIGGCGGGGTDTFVSSGGIYFDKSNVVIDELRKILQSF